MTRLKGCWGAQAGAEWARLQTLGAWNTNHLLELHLDLSVDLSHLEQDVPCAERRRGRKHK